jgi:sensor histidine kinase YesM
MKKVYKQIVLWLGICTILGAAFGLIFGYLYNQYLRFLIIALSISYTILLFNSLLLIFISPKIKKLPPKKRNQFEIFSFFITTLIGFFISISILSKIFRFSVYTGKIFLVNMGLLVGLYMMVTGLNFSFRFYKELKEKELAEEKLKALAGEAKLKALKSKINPHFLFNTLNSVNALLSENPSLARKVIDRLSALLRVSLESDEKMLLPLRKELDFAHLYLEIEKIRFNDKLEFLESVDPEMLDVPFPAMVLQPLLENAVKHGIARSRQGGTIELIVQKKERSLWCAISNTGGGSSADRIPNSEARRTGIANIRQRLDLLFKGRYEFRAGYLESGKFEASLLLPLDWAIQDEKD